MKEKLRSVSDLKSQFNCRKNKHLFGKVESFTALHNQSRYLSCVEIDGCVFK